MVVFFVPTEIYFFTTDIPPSFLNEDDRIRDNRLSKLHDRFQR